MTREPALLVGAVNALLALAVGFGLPITIEQAALINAAVAALLAVVVRQQVTPVSSTRDGGHADFLYLLGITVAVACGILLAALVVRVF